MIFFKELSATVKLIELENIPVIPLNSVLEQTMIPSAEKIKARIEVLFRY